MILLFGHDITIPLAVLIFSTGCVLGWMLKKGKVTQAVADEILSSQKGLIELLSSKVKSLAADLTEANERADREHDQRVQTVECIALIEKERNTWQKKYLGNHGLRPLGRPEHVSGRNDSTK